jgi:uncharacterized membrane-anchored protein
MKQLIVFILALLATFSLRAGDEDSLDTKKIIDSIESTMHYQTGEIKLSNGVAKLNVPAGFKYLSQEQSKYVLTELWGNPPSDNVLGMIFPEWGGASIDSSYAFVITYQAIGYVKDGDAEDINYDDLLKDIQKGEIDENKERAKMGYPPVNTVGWAQKPYYDKVNKTLHWAMKLQFGGHDDQTLNYDVRILGRKGILSLNAVANLSEMDVVKQDIDKVLHIASFTEGNTYKEFDSNVDEVAAWTIGGLVAGKVLAKVGFLPFLIKFGKFIIIGIAALGGAFFKFFKRKKKDEFAYDAPQAPQDNQPIQ